MCLPFDFQFRFPLYCLPRGIFIADSAADEPLFIAFILYRQHYQAQVIAQNPGLANPEISKIIGEQWREQAPEVKNDWKRLAEVYEIPSHS
jgi:HMG (high mobility group) box